MMALCVVALVSLGSAGNAFGALIPGAGPQSLDRAALAQDITAKALTDHECDSSEWHFVINQIDDAAHAPASIHVTWANGNSEDVPLDKFTGGVAHYSTTSNLDSQVTSATASIYDGWDGEFNLSHGPCGVAAPTETPTNTPVPPTNTPTNTPTLEVATSTPTSTPTEVHNPHIDTDVKVSVLCVTVNPDGTYTIRVRISVENESNQDQDIHITKSTAEITPGSADLSAIVDFFEGQTIGHGDTLTQTFDFVLDAQGQDAFEIDFHVIFESVQFPDSVDSKNEKDSEDFNLSTTEACEVPTATNTPTDTPTNTPVPPTETPTNTAVPPTNTPTNTPPVIIVPTDTPTQPSVLVPTDTPTQPSTVEGETATAVPSATPEPTGSPTKVAGVSTGEGMPSSGVGSTFSDGNSVSIFLLLVLAAFAGAAGWQIRPRERRR